MAVVLFLNQPPSPPVSHLGSHLERFGRVISLGLVVVYFNHMAEGFHLFACYACVL